ncbi:uncharacterized protein LOC130826571 [Amaranthus tricolor]|uniref:uncharacterized protein LOC130826571 n=1 Tax=Amaranthus tricolor TaxID=29722 RepID=UPI00258BD22D|nr:uncharacterized protein LOC130826571 [Amaranthus tricolor]
MVNNFYETKRQIAALGLPVEKIDSLMWTINDFPAYSMLSGWSTAGRYACPYCMDDSQAFYLTHSKKVCWFDCHRRFLDKSHPYRRNRTNFRAGIVEKRDPPFIRTGFELLDELDQFGFLKVNEEDAPEHNKEVSKYSAGWKKRSIFWDLPYWKTSTIRHNLDVMHIEKNDHIKGRHDLRELGIRSELHPIGTSIPKASYTLNEQQIRALLQWLKSIRFPDGYVSNMARNIDMAKHQLFGMKSHDCHVFMQRLIPIAFRELLPVKVWEALTELSLYFRSLTTTKLCVEDLRKMEADIPVIICKLETIFPPTFFDSMEHLPIHLAYEARIAGPVQYRWMYPFERYLRHLKLNVRNKAHVEASICNAYLTEEASHFVSHYFEPHVRCRVRDLPRNNDGSYNNIVTGVFTIFSHPIRFHGKGLAYILDERDYEIAHRYVLMNCPEVDVFISEFKSSIQRHQPNWSSQRIEAFVQENFANAFRTAARQGSFDNRVNSDILKQIAEGPLKYARSYNVCYTNGYRFHTVRHASNKLADNSGVCVKAGDNSRDEEDFYGQLLEIVEVEYPRIPIKRVTLFKCHWYDPTTTGNSHGTNIHKRYKLVDIHQGRSYHLYDPFVLVHDNDEDTEEDVDLVLSEDEQSEDEDVENDDYFSDED